MLDPLSVSFNEYVKLFYEDYFIDYYKDKKTGNLYHKKDVTGKYIEFIKNK